VEADFWHERWRDGRIGFHQSSVAPSLRHLWPTLDLPPGSTVFVPLCGKSLDSAVAPRSGSTTWLAWNCRKLRSKSFFAENGISGSPSMRGVISTSTSLRPAPVAGDLFELTPQILEPVAAVYDRASLIAMPPALQGQDMRENSRS
jgi:thiopurine S-methyltransferase